MRFLSNKTETHCGVDIAFAERLSAITNRGRGIGKLEAVAEFERGTERIEQTPWTDLSDDGEQSVAA